PLRRLRHSSEWRPPLRGWSWTGPPTLAERGHRAPAPTRAATKTASFSCGYPFWLQNYRSQDAAKALRTQCSQAENEDYWTLVQYRHDRGRAGVRDVSRHSRYARSIRQDSPSRVRAR